jgi:hypothetical protein
MANVIIGVIIGARSIQKSAVSLLLGVMQVEVIRGGTPGKLGMLVRGAMSARPRQRRQSGVVDINGELREGVHQQRWVRAWDVTNI